MPFDSLTQTDQGAVVDPEAVYRERRRVCVALWENPVRPFDIRDFVHPCGTTACALGDLALREHDGWHLDQFRCPVRDHGGSFLSAELYFALSERDAERCFNSGGEYGKPDAEVTLADVSARLLSLPVTVHGERG